MMRISSNRQQLGIFVAGPFYLTMSLCSSSVEAVIQSFLNFRLTPAPGPNGVIELLSIDPMPLNRPTTKWTGCFHDTVSTELCAQDFEMENSRVVPTCKMHRHMADDLFDVGASSDLCFSKWSYKWTVFCFCPSFWMTESLFFWFHISVMMLPMMLLLRWREMDGTLFGFCVTLCRASSTVFEDYATRCWEWTTRRKNSLNLVLVSPISFP